MPHAIGCSPAGHRRRACRMAIRARTAGHQARLRRLRRSPRSSTPARVTTPPHAGDRAVDELRLSRTSRDCSSLAIVGRIGRSTDTVNGIDSERKCAVTAFLGALTDCRFVSILPGAWEADVAQRGSHPTRGKSARSIVGAKGGSRGLTHHATAPTAASKRRAKEPTYSLTDKRGIAMPYRSKLLLAALIATLLVALSAATATASRSFSVVGGGRAILAIANGERRLTFQDPNTGTEVINLITLHGSIHALIAKSAGSLVGVVNRVTLGPEAECRTNIFARCSTTAEVGAGWHLVLLSFTGTLPRIESIRIHISGATFRLRIGNPETATEATYRGNPEGIALTPEDRAGSREATSITADERVFIRRERCIRSEFFRPCPEEGAFVGSLRLSSPIRFRLH